MVLILISCEANLTTINEKTSNGALYKSYSIDKDSLIQGILQVFYEDGKTLFAESNYLNNKLNGTRTLYYESGQPEIIASPKHSAKTSRDSGSNELLRMLRASSSRTCARFKLCLAPGGWCVGRADGVLGRLLNAPGERGPGSALNTR